MTIKQWQEVLASAGYYKGAIDGIAGPMTKAATRTYQTFLRDRGFDPGTIDGILGPLTLAAHREFLSAQADSYLTLPPPPPSAFALTPEVRKMVYRFEIGGGIGYYNAALKRPSWPGYSSGLTIGIGYDLGYVTDQQFRNDWSRHLSAAWINALAPAIGVTGSRAKNFVAGTRHIEIPFAAAEAVFDTSTVPRYWDLAKKALPGIERLHANAQGALWSLGYNRGWSMSTAPSRAEMRELPPLVARAAYGEIANVIERMTRLWPENEKSDHDLCDRRRAEAALVRNG